ncbi:MAG: hypothetical protein RLN76_10870 [Phycisphaeraceae bacterium]
MSTPVVQRYAGPITGAFVVGVLLLLFFIVLAAGARGGWLASNVPITITLPHEGAFGLRQGAEIQALGIVVGNVSTIRVAGDRLVAHGSVRQDLAQLVTVDAPVRIKKTLVLGGDTYLDIGAGTGTTFAEGEPLALLAAADPSVENLPSELQSTLATIASAAQAYEQIAHEFRDPDGRYQRIITAADQITHDLQQVSTALDDNDFAGTLEALRQRMDSMIANLDQLMTVATEGVQTATATVRGIDQQLAYLPELAEQSAGTIELIQGNLTELKDVIQSLQSITDTLGEELRDAPGSLVQLRATLREVEELSRALRNSWLVTGPGGADADPRHDAEAAGGAVDLIGSRR